MKDSVRVALPADATPSAVAVENSTAKSPTRRVRFQAARRSLGIAYYQQHDSEPVQVLPGLFLGSVGAAMNAPRLLELGVRAVVTVSDQLSQPPYPDLFRYLVMPFADNPTAAAALRQEFAAIFAFMRQGIEDGGVLVHCFAGKSRSVSVILGFLLHEKHWSLVSSLEYLKCRRPVMQPNLGFVAELLAYQKELVAQGNELIDATEDLAIN
eukprot:TRINITY_DN682_c0_g1_i1.p1 TRINITY_DN682_c0_g1~~TRINITY_DN682_c0_g1_i1.p1  ORF type:complete len:220 (-),score=31.79 TRINITY_DN682_c0_g1_i1:399-1031(-)